MHALVCSPFLQVFYIKDVQLGARGPQTTREAFCSMRGYYENVLYLIKINVLSLNYEKNMKNLKSYLNIKYDQFTFTS